MNDNHFIAFSTLRNMGLDIKSVKKALLGAEISIFLNGGKITENWQIQGWLKITEYCDPGTHFGS